MCHAPDGASNAVGSSLEFQAMTDATKADSIWHYTCYAHQINQAAKYASGTGDFKDNKNVKLGNVIKKLHKINACVYCSETRLQLLFKVQKDKEWHVVLQCWTMCVVPM
jgi:hypothetical protein